MTGIVRVALRHSIVCAVAAMPLAAQASRFPDTWIGRWSGTLTTASPPDSVRNRIPITLEIAREATGSAYTWRTVFNRDTVRGLRPYRMIPENPARGHYATDEANGVLLDETYIDGTLSSVFQVGDQVLSSRYALRGDTLTHEVLWWKPTPTRTVRGSGANSEQGATIMSFRVLGMQRAVFTRER